MKGILDLGARSGGRPLPKIGGPADGPRGRRSAVLRGSPWARPAGEGLGSSVLAVVWAALASGISAQPLPLDSGEGAGSEPRGPPNRFLPVEMLPVLPVTGEPVRIRWALPVGDGEAWSLWVPRDWHVVEPLLRKTGGVEGRATWEAILIPLRPGELAAPAVVQGRGGPIPLSADPGNQSRQTVSVRSLLPPPPYSAEPAPLLPSPTTRRSALPFLLWGVALMGVMSNWLRVRSSRASCTLSPAEPVIPPTSPPPFSNTFPPRASSRPLLGDALQVLRALSAAWEAAPPPPPPLARGILDQVVEGVKSLLASSVGRSLKACTTAELLELAAEREGTPALEVLCVCLQAADRGRFGPEAATREAFVRSLAALREWLDALGAGVRLGREEGPSAKGAAAARGRDGVYPETPASHRGRGGGWRRW